MSKTTSSWEFCKSFSSVGTETLKQCFRGNDGVCWKIQKIKREGRKLKQCEFSPFFIWSCWDFMLNRFRNLWKSLSWKWWEAQSILQNHIHQSYNQPRNKWSIKLWNLIWQQSEGEKKKEVAGVETFLMHFTSFYFHIEIGSTSEVDRTNLIVSLLLSVKSEQCRFWRAFIQFFFSFSPLS